MRCVPCTCCYPLMSAIPLRPPNYHYNHSSPIRLSKPKTFRLDVGKFSDDQKGPALVPSYEKPHRGSSQALLPITQSSPPNSNASISGKRTSLLGFPVAIVVAASCCCLGSIVFTLSIFFITQEMSITRQQVMPLINAAVPIMQDGTQISGLVVGTTQKVLNIAEIAKNASLDIEPILFNVRQFMNESSKLVSHMEYFSRHPSLHIDLGKAND
jgi:hypothetical protein